MNKVKKFEMANRKQLILVLALVAALVVSPWGAASLKDARTQFAGVVQVRLGQDALTAKQVEKMRERRDQEGESARYVAWTQKQDVEVANPDLDRKIRLDQCTYVYGDDEGDFSFLLDKGCSLSADLAEKLFGTAEGVEGEFVEVENIRYIIERVDGASRRKAIFKVAENSGIRLDVINISGRGNDEMLAVEDLLFREGVRGRLTIDYDALMAFFRSLSTAPLWLVLVGGLLLWRRAQKQAEAGRTTVAWVKKGIRIGSSVGLLFAGYGIWGLPFYLPAGAMPTRWSDFSFWSYIISHDQDQGAAYAQLATYGPDQLFQQSMVQLLISGLLLAVLFAVGIDQIRKTRKLAQISAVIENRLLQAVNHIIEKFIHKR